VKNGDSHIFQDAGLLTLPSLEEKVTIPIFPRRAFVNSLGILVLAAAMPDITRAATGAPKVRVGAEILVERHLDQLAGKRVGLITNHTGLAGGEHLADVLARTKGLTLAAILAPEHGFRGAVEAGAKVSDGRDEKTGVPVLSLYGATRKPTPAMLKGLDILVFDIQDIGVRFYTYISTMGLAMQAAAEAKIPFLVLDRPNPLGGEYVAGFTMEKSYVSFVGQFEIPQVHGLTVGELANMIRGEKLLSGLDKLDLRILAMDGWKRSMRWPETGRAWVRTSPNIPTFITALVYPGVGLVEGIPANEGRGTDTPFLQLGAPWLDGKRLAARMTAAKLPGATFAAVEYTPRPLPGVANSPRFEGKRVSGLRITVTDHKAYRPLDVGAHFLSGLAAEAKASGTELFDKTAMFDRLAGTRRLRALLEKGASGSEIISAYEPDVEAFRKRREPYLIYR
jgi:uncharacterized protein YbbC (DUF1343 family)